MRLKPASGEKEASRATARQDDSGASYAKYIAVRLYGMNPRVPIFIDGKQIGMLKLKPARNVRLHYNVGREKRTVHGVIGAALVVDFDVGIEFDKGDEFRIRVFSPVELRRFAYRLLEYADLLEVLNISNIDVSDIARQYFGSAGGRAAPRKEPAEKTVEEDIGEAEFEDVGVS